MYVCMYMYFKLKKKADSKSKSSQMLNRHVFSNEYYNPQTKVSCNRTLDDLNEDI